MSATRTLSHAAGRATLCALGGVAMSCVLAGCMNGSTTLVGAGADPLPDLAPDVVATNLADPTSSTTARSITDLNRAHWPLIVIFQPRGQVESSVFGGPEPAFALQRGPAANPPSEPILFR